jgi:hypothetical protein
MVFAGHCIRSSASLWLVTTAQAAHFVKLGGPGVASSTPSPPWPHTLNPQVREEFLSLMARHSTGRVLSNQARRQLKMACLAAATHSVLMRVTGGDADAVDEHIRQSMGR